MAQFSAETQALIDRIAAVDYAVATVDRAVVESAFNAHLTALDLPERPVRWLDDASSGYAYVLDKAERTALGAARDAARDAAWGAAWGAAWDAAWDAARGSAWDAAWGAAWDAARGSAWDAARDAARGSAWGAARDAARGSAWGAAWDAARDAARAVWLPFVDAFEAGLFLFWITPDEIIAVPRPVILIQDDRLHCSDGPAVHWPGGERYWFWRGVQVPQKVIEQPNALTPAEIRDEENVEVRRVMIERFGADRFLTGVGAELLQQDDWGKLWRAELPDDEALVMVECVDPSTDRTYHLRVPPDRRTAKDALAWTFDMGEEKYEPAVQT